MERFPIRLKKDKESASEGSRKADAACEAGIVQTEPFKETAVPAADEPVQVSNEEEIRKCQRLIQSVLP